MCGIYTDPHEIARSLTIAAADKVVINQAGKSVDESNIELGRQMALVYKTILSELSREDTDFDEVAHTHSHPHNHGDDDAGHTHDHAHEHTHSHVH